MYEGKPTIDIDYRALEARRKRARIPIHTLAERAGTPLTRTYYSLKPRLSKDELARIEIVLENAERERERGY